MAVVGRNVIEILKKSEVLGNRIYLPQLTLERKTYLNVNSILNSIGAKWNTKAKCHIAENDIEEEISYIIDTERYEDVKREYQFFETPKFVVEEMLEQVRIEPDSKILEPSAGQGAIISGIMPLLDFENGGVLDSYELNKQNHKILLKKFYENKDKFMIGECFLTDFLTIEPNPKYDFVIQNPPFRNQQDILHIKHAYKFLKKLGTLVSVCSRSPFFRENKKSVEFREWLESKRAQVSELPEGAFKDSGTMVKANLIVINR